MVFTGTYIINKTTKSLNHEKNSLSPSLFRFKTFFSQFKKKKAWRYFDSFFLEPRKFFLDSSKSFFCVLGAKNSPIPTGDDSTV